MADITPLVPADRQIIESYGDGRFRITGTVHEGSVLVLPSATLAWPLTDIDRLTFDSLAPIVAPDAAIELLLIGSGRSMRLLDGALRARLREAGVVCEIMDTGAACRTFNVLVAEDRRVAAALIAVA
jgi:uncharacterized protein